MYKLRIYAFIGALMFFMAGRASSEKIMAQKKYKVISCENLFHENAMDSSFCLIRYFVAKVFVNKGYYVQLKPINKSHKNQIILVKVTEKSEISFLRKSKRLYLQFSPVDLSKAFPKLLQNKQVMAFELVPAPISIMVPIGFFAIAFICFNASFPKILIAPIYSRTIGDPTPLRKKMKERRMKKRIKNKEVNIL